MAGLAVSWFVIPAAAQTPLCPADHLAPDRYELGAYPTRIHAVDLDDDGDDDLAVTNYSSSFVSILIDEGATFRKEATIPVCCGSSIDHGDFDRDGNVDLAIANYSAAQLAIVLGNGDGTFSTPLVYQAPHYARDVACADFDRDGIVDLALATDEPGLVAMFLGNGDGTFRTSASAQVGSAPSALEAGDVDNDSNVDLVVSDQTNASFAYLRGKGDGRFHPPLFVPAARAKWIALGDLNHDSRLDVVTGGGETTIVLRGLSGTFLPPVSYAGFGEDINIGDADGDGHPDLLGRSVSILYGTGTGTFLPLQRIEVSSADELAAIAGDFSGDGLVDIATTAGNLCVIKGLGGRKFQLPRHVALAGIPEGVGAGDLDGDGDDDLVASNQAFDCLSILRNDGAGNFQRSTTPFNGIPGAGRLLTARIDGDSHLDVAVCITSSAYVAFFHGFGNGTFDTPSINPVGSSPRDVVLGDLDEDGRGDIVTPNAGGRSVTILFGGPSGPGTRLDLPTGMGAGGVAVEDVNHDTHADLVVVGDDRVVTILGQGTRTFNPPIVSTGGSTLEDCELIDFNGDSHIDLVATEDYLGNYALFAGVGNGNFTFLGRSDLGSNPTDMTRADINGDGRMDVLISVVQSNAVIRLLGSPAGLVQDESAAVLSPSAVTTADVDGDDLLDIVVSEYHPRTLGVVFGTGIGIAPAVLPEGVAGSSYTQVLAAQDGTPPLTFSATNLPPGVQLSPTGTISGVPTASGKYKVDVEVSDAAACRGHRAYELVIANPRR